MISYTDQIKAAVTAREVFEHYGFEINRAGFCRSPFAANDKTPSLKVYDGDRGWHDFSSGKGGDVISFVQEYFNLSFQDAVKKLNDDLRLGFPIGERLTADKQREAERAAQERQRKALQEKQERRRLEAEYNAALDWWVYLDKVKRDNEAFSAEWCYAVKKLETANHRLTCAEIALYKFEHRAETS